MSKIGRFLGNVKAFASEALGTERTIFGSTAQSNALTDQINALYRRGWAGVSATETPTYQDFNALGYTLGQFIAYLHQMGIAEYHAQQEYYKGAVVIFDGNLYQAVKDSPSGQPVGNPDNWYSFKSAIDSKASTTYVNSALATKADAATVNSALSTKASNSALATKADATTVNNALATKASTTYVNSALATKADAATVNNALATKASTTYVDQQIATRETPAGAQTKVNTHANNKSNPHAVTKEQVGLGNVPNWSQATFDGRYEAKGSVPSIYKSSGEYSLTEKTTPTWSHGQDKIPAIFMAVLVCKTAELGYSVGDEVANFFMWDRRDSSTANAPFASASSIGLPLGDSSIRVIRRTNATDADFRDITKSRWRLKFKAIFI